MRRLFEHRGFRVDERNELLLRAILLHNYRMSKRLDRMRKGAGFLRRVMFLPG